MTSDESQAVGEAEFHVSTRTRGRCLLEVPGRGAARRCSLAITATGSWRTRNSHAFAALRLPDGGYSSRSQALHPFYLGRSSSVGASWMTSADREMAIEDNLAYVAAAEAAVRREHPVNTVVHAGFSQGVAMAFRAAVAGGTTAGVVALGGDIPPEVRVRPARVWEGLRVLLGRGERDEWYSQAKMDDDAAFLRTRPVALATSVFDGGHEWLPAFSAAASALIDECLTRGWPA